ncbi:MAG: hypothetical protein HY719_10400 [Planctomycetes bacterium]|nr:hypothetical protein [Planctomycetota bacterium]
MSHGFKRFVVVLFALLLAAGRLHAQAAAPGAGAAPAPAANNGPKNGPLTDDEKKAVNAAIDRGAQYLLNTWDKRGKYVNTWTAVEEDLFILYTIASCGGAKSPKFQEAYQKTMKGNLNGFAPSLTNAVLLMLKHVAEPENRLSQAQLAWFLLDQQMDDGDWDYEARPKGANPQPFHSSWPNQFPTSPKPGPKYLHLTHGGTADIKGAPANGPNPAGSGPAADKRATAAAPTWLLVDCTPGWPKADTGSARNFLVTQYAVLALHCAMQSGVAVDARAFRLLEQTLLRTQAEEGGWPYVDPRDKKNWLFNPQAGKKAAGQGAAGQGRFSTPYPTVAAANVATLVICQGYSEKKDPQVMAAIVRGIAYLSRDENRFLTWDDFQTKGFIGDIKINSADAKQLDLVGHGAEHFWYYYLYAIERVGVIAGLDTLGGCDWYGVGARELLRLQDQEGGWGSKKQEERLVNTCLALQFLRRSTPPVKFPVAKDPVKGPEITQAGGKVPAAAAEKPVPPGDGKASPGDGKASPGENK